MNRDFWRRYAAVRSGGFEGFSVGTFGTKATLLIGRRAGLCLEGWRPNERIPLATAVRAIKRARERQVGRKNVSFGYVGTGGFYKGVPEPSLKVELIWTGEGDRKSFDKQVRELAENAARSLAQQEIYVEWDAPRRRGRVDVATPKGAPSSSSKKFQGWVRKHLVCR